MKRLLLLAVLAVVFTFAAFLSEGYSQIRETGKPAMRCAKHFDAMDTNHDDVVTKEEFMAFRQRGRNAERVFNARDTNHDGKLTKDEFCAGRGGWRGGRQQSQ